MQPTAARSRLRSTFRVGVPLFLVAFLASGCLLPPDPATAAGQDVFNLYLIVLALAAIVFFGVEGFILYAIFRYRRRPGDDVLPEQHHGNTAVEIVWTIIPTVIVFILFGFSLVTLGEVEASSEDPGVEIRVEGFQWSWRFHYPGEVVSGPQGAEPPVLGVPVDEPVRVILESDNVNHAFYVPEFLLKRDLIPGQTNVLEFTVTEPGTYAGQCAEFCGTAHADMVFTVEAVERADYDAWLAALASGEPPPGPGAGDCETTIQLAAVESFAFDTDLIEVPAGEAFCVEFTNNDTVDHDFGIVETEYNGEDVGPGESITYLVPALEAGEYTFFCTLHPTQMVGDLVVQE